MHRLLYLRRRPCPARPSACPADWNELAEDVYFPYAMAKVESEKRAWELAKEYGSHRWRLVTIIPGLITGPPDSEHACEAARPAEAAPAAVACCSSGAL